jgi:hypothetical protein
VLVVVHGDVGGVEVPAPDAVTASVAQE